MARFDVMTIGAATQDIFLRSAHFQERRDRQAPDGLDAVLPFGAKIGVDDLFVASGGGATNAAVTFARFDFRTSCISSVGQDPGGDLVLNELKREGVSTFTIARSREYATATSVILLSGTGHRAILTYRGASAHLRLEHVAWENAAHGFIYLTSLNGDRRSLGKIFQAAERFGITLAWNPGARELEQGIKKLSSHLRQTDILILNREEAALLTGRPPRQLPDALKTLASLVKTAVAITDGERGAYVSDKTRMLFTPSLKAKRVNTTGAGDAFGSAFAAALLKNCSIEDALKIGMLNATSVVCHMGAKAGILLSMPAQKNLSHVKIRTIPNA